MDAKDLVESHQLGKEDELSGKNDPESMEWIRNVEAIIKSNEESKTAFIGELNKRFDSQTNGWWEEIRKGENRRSKWLARSICYILAYYTQCFTEKEISCI